MNVRQAFAWALPRHGSMMEPGPSWRAWLALCVPTAPRIGGRGRADGGMAGRVSVRVARALLSIWIALGTSTVVAAGGQVRVSDAWVPSTVPGQTVGAAYMQLRSAEDAALVKVETSAASTAEIHQMKTVNDVMLMRRLDQVKLPAGHAVQLSPGATHVMLIDLRQPLKVGDSVPLKLTFRFGDGRTVEESVVAPVVARAARGGQR